MPYASLAAAPFTMHKGVKMTLAQVNFWARIYDTSLAGYKKRFSLKVAKTKAAQTAWSVFDAVYMIEGTGKNRRFVRKKKR